MRRPQILTFCASKYAHWWQIKKKTFLWRGLLLLNFYIEKNINNIFWKSTFFSADFSISVKTAGAAHWLILIQIFKTSNVANKNVAAYMYSMAEIGQQFPVKNSNLEQYLFFLCRYTQFSTVIFLTKPLRRVCYTFLV